MSIFRSDAPLPIGHGSADTEQILQYLAALRQELQYALTHLDTDNFTDEGLCELAQAVREYQQKEEQA